MRPGCIFVPARASNIRQILSSFVVEIMGAGRCQSSRRSFREPNSSPVIWVEHLGDGSPEPCGTEARGRPSDGDRE